MKLLKVDDVAARLALNPATVRAMVKREALPVVRPTGGRAVRVPEDAVEAIMRGQGKAE